MALRRLRSALFVPGNQSRMLEKALGFSPDAVMPDMEDSVPPNEKHRAREVIAANLPLLAKKADWMIIPRVNGLDTGLLEDDLSSILNSSTARLVHGISIGKISCREDMDRLDDMLSSWESKTSMKPNTLKVIPWLETTKGVINAHSICQSKRIIAVAFGADDYAADFEIERTDSGEELAFARNMISVAAHASGVQALDTPHVNFKDPESLRRACATVKRMGYTGKFAIHPSQVEVINGSFSPSAHDIKRARQIVDAWEKAAQEGRGSTSLDGKMIDIPVLRRAQRVLAGANGTDRKSGPV
eukprot:GILK01006416.1.p1 GENE.GILK01006416.1~~GILK01006416.1.p1  ORF type:complete len:315 (+),score=48.10 GILK01006416.1:45-947(+)